MILFMPKCFIKSCWVLISFDCHIQPHREQKSHISYILKPFMELLDTTVRIPDVKQAEVVCSHVGRGTQESQLCNSRSLLPAMSMMGHAGSPCQVVGCITDSGNFRAG